MSGKVATFVSTLVIHFPVRFVDRKGNHDPAREKEWLRSIVEAIGYYEPDVLQAAAQRIIDTRNDRRFPLPSEIRKVCAEVIDDRRKASLPVHPAAGDKKLSPWSPERVKLANELVQTEIGRRAAREGWLLILHDWVRANGELPRSDSKIRELAGEKVHFEKAYSDCVRGWGGPAGKQLAELGDKMIAREAELRVMVLGEGA
jgi:hypothetical protein